MIDDPWALGPPRVKLTPARWGWNSVVLEGLTTTDPPWWRPTKAGARRVAHRSIRRQQARQAREARSAEETLHLGPCGAHWVEWNPDGTPLEEGYCEGDVYVHGEASAGRCGRCGAEATP